jgi:hypothetical protein
VFVLRKSENLPAKYVVPRVVTNELADSHLKMLRVLEKGDTTRLRFDREMPCDDQNESAMRNELFQLGGDPDVIDEIALRNLETELCTSIPQGEGVISHGDMAEPVTPAMTVSGWYPAAIPMSDATELESTANVRIPEDESNESFRAWENVPLKEVPRGSTAPCEIAQIGFAISLERKQASTVASYRPLEELNCTIPIDPAKSAVFARTWRGTTTLAPAIPCWYMVAPNAISCTAKVEYFAAESVATSATNLVLEFAQALEEVAEMDHPRAVGKRREYQTEPLSVSAMNVRYDALVGVNARSLRPWRGGAMRNDVEEEEEVIADPVEISIGIEGV